MPKFLRVPSWLIATCLITLHMARGQSAGPDLTHERTLYVVGYAHLDTEWRWEYPQVSDEYIRKTMEDNFKLIDRYPHYIFNFSGANRYRLMKEYFPADFAKVEIGGKRDDLTVQDWSGFVGQWDDRTWIGKDTAVPANPAQPAHTDHDDYSEMTGIQPGYIKRADIAWYCSHYHDARGRNVAYAYSYFFAYALDVPPGAKTILLPNNDKIRIYAIAMAKANPDVRPTQSLYDDLRAVATAKSKP